MCTDRRALTPLSALQRRLLELSATGAGTAEIASVLQLPDDEIRAHVVRAIGVLGARSKLEAVLVAHRRGLFQPRDG